MIESGLYELLTSAPTLAPLMANNGVHFALMAKGAPLPAVVIHRVASPPEVITLDGTSAVTRARFQIECYAQDGGGQGQASSSGYLSAAQLALAIRQLLQDLSGELPDGTAIQCCVFGDEYDANFQEGGAGYVFRRVLDLTLWFQ